ncbi:MAG: aldehyde dehydrogenase, partial [Chloroflexi bacterium]|nr:aldehyde dehydrogenase [Chloroflexota bacterium]
MWYGWTGTELEIDLSRGSIQKNQGDRATYETYLGGQGLITKLFWDRVPPETEPFSPDNLLIFGAGPLVGTAAPGANRTNMVTRSPVTNYLSFSTMGGFWGPELKFAGYDTLILSGKSPSPVYIYINNDKVEIRDASHLWGKDVFETQRLIRAELKNNNIQILCIGPAGENRVYFASIEHGLGRSMSRAGVGAIMGDKKVKAIAVYGTRDINLARPGPFLELVKEFNRRCALRLALSGGGDDDDGGQKQRKKIELKVDLKGKVDDEGEARLRGKNLYRNFELMKSWKGRDEALKELYAKRGRTE